MMVQNFLELCLHMIQGMNGVRGTETSSFIGLGNLTLALMGKSMISNATFFATLHYLFHSYYIMHAFQELVLLP